jgi:hypothetical protein
VLRNRAADTATDTATELHKRAAVKRSRRAQTVLGDRHDPVREILLQVQSGGLRNSPGRIFQRLYMQTEVRRKKQRKQRRIQLNATAATAESFETVIEVDFSLYSKRAFFVFVSTNRKMAEPPESQRLRAAPTRLQQSIRRHQAENRRVPLQVQRHIQVR